MKKLFLLVLVLCIGLYANAQKQAKIPSHLLNKTEKMFKAFNGEELPVILSESNPYVTSNPAKDLGLQIGITYYDFQGNSNNTNRMMVYSDGSISAVWTMSIIGTTSYPDRGTGYNHSTNGGVSWLPDPTARLEGATRTGWPTIARLTDGSELDVTHTAVGGNMCKTTDGGLTWVNSEVGGSVLSICWPRMVTNGNTIHVIANSTTTVPYEGFTNGALVYLRSTDGGTTWSAPVIPTGLDISNYPTHNGGAGGTFSDEYFLACKGNTVAIVVGSAYATPALVKSTNNGDTWSYKEILHLPIKKFEPDGSVIYDINNDAQQDNVYSSDAANFVVLDNSGKAHVFFGRMKYTSDGATGSYFPATDGLYYWNEDMGTINYQYKWTMINSTNTYEGIPDTVNFPIITEVVDINNNGIMDLPENGADFPFGSYRFSALCSHPSAVISNDGSITLFYSSIVEGTDGTVGSQHLAYRNVWEIHKSPYAPNNFTWSDPVRIAEDDYTEEVWPCVSPILTGNSPANFGHLWYQGDGSPGNALQPGTTIQTISENQIYYVKYPIPVGINEINVVKSEPVVYPNPASGNVTVNYNLTASSNVTLSIYNLVGQQIMTTTQFVTAGDVQVSLNIEALTQGVYFIKSDIGKQSFTNKLVVK